ncbi:hypothetical protein [Tenacibaculum aiptasiae]|uniref:hypothetical protein n=1 Tax=Tenacibaculum aiptasiae TaxID=426481 RepID=UPI00232F09C3|nr:hypothetical protein [Tenacibaculum aiptasiae]
MTNSIRVLLVIICFVSFKIQSQAPQKTNSILEQWNYIVFDKGGCLGGGQYVTKNKREIPTMVFSQKEWKKFSNNKKEKLTEFLIKRLSDTTKTQIHTCPFFVATNGEMAVYALQHIHNKNWFDFNEFKSYKNKETKSAIEQKQIWLQNILKDKMGRKKLTELFLNQLKK